MSNYPTTPPTGPAFYWQRRKKDGYQRPVEVRFFPATTSLAWDDGDAPVGNVLLWSSAGDSSWWDTEGLHDHTNMADWEWGPMLVPGP